MKKLLVLVIVVIALGAGAYGYVTRDSGPVAGTFAPVGGGTYRLGSSIGSTDTSITLSSFKNRSDIALTMTLLNTSVGYGTLDPQTSRSEFVTFTGITQNANGTATLTGVSRGISDIYPYTASSTLRKTHAGQSIFILSDSPSLFNEYAVKQNDETITGNWTFTSTNTPAFNFNPTWGSEASTTFASKGYVDGVSIAGAANSSETVNGISELATAAEAGAGTSAGGTAARLVLPASLATSTPTASCSAYCVVMATAGKIAQGFLDLTASFTFSGAVNFTGTLQDEGQAGGLVPVGSLQAYASSTAPTGWLYADGTAVSRATYSALYSVIGTTYGAGDGSTTFNLPNLKGRNIMGFGSASTTHDTLGEVGGEDTHKLTTAELPSHTHSVAGFDGIGSSASPAGSDGAGSLSMTTGSAGSDTAHNVLDPFIVLYFIIKT